MIHDSYVNIIYVHMGNYLWTK